MADTAAVVIVLIFIIIVFIGIGVGLYFFYRWFTTRDDPNPPPSPQPAVPGKKYSIRSLKTSNVYITRAERNDQLDSCVFLDEFVGFRKNPLCSRVNWLYDQDKSLKLEASDDLYLSASPTMCGARDALVLVGSPVAWNFDATRRTICTESNKCLKFVSLVGSVGGITSETLTPSQFDGLSESDQLSYQWQTADILTGKTDPVCISSK